MDSIEPGPESSGAHFETRCTKTPDDLLPKVLPQSFQAQLPCHQAPDGIVTIATP